MLRLDLPTTLLSFALCSMLSLLVMVSLWRQNRHQYAGTQYWVLFFLMQFSGSALLFSRGQLPDVLTIVVANGLIVGGVLLLQKGLAQFLECPYNPRFSHGLFSAFLLVHSYFALVDSNAHLRNLNASLVLAVFGAMIAWLLLVSTPPVKRPATAMVGWTMAGYSAISALRFVGELIVPAQPGNAFSNPQAVYLGLTYQSFSLLLTFSLALMVNRSLLANLQQQLADLAQARGAAEAANRSKSAFLANMSHEIRTPLNAVLGMAHMALQAEPLPRQREFLHKIQRSGKHLLAVISDILDFSKIEANKLVLEQGPVDLEALAGNVATMLEDSTRDKGLQLVVRVDSMPSGLLGDATRLGQALLNYAGNAVKFTESGTIHLQVSVLEETDASVLVRLEVQDTGVGIAADKLPTLFEPFVQADNSTTRQYGGSGLGLAITRRLAEAMGGSVGVSSSVGQGSRFWFTARLQKGALAPVHTSRTALPGLVSELQAQHRNRPVLLVEDDDFSCEVGLILLEDVGLQVDVARDGQVATQMALAKDYDLILMDMQMPVLDGVEATRQLRRAGARMPIVAMTANAFLEDKRKCLDAGMDDFLTKPVDPAALYDALLRQFTRQRT